MTTPDSPPIDRALIPAQETVADLDAGLRLLELSPGARDAVGQTTLAENYRSKNAPADADVFIKPIQQKTAVVGFVEAPRAARGGADGTSRRLGFI